MKGRLGHAERAYRVISVPGCSNASRRIDKLGGAGCEVIQGRRPDIGVSANAMKLCMCLVPLHGSEVACQYARRARLSSCDIPSDLSCIRVGAVRAAGAAVLSFHLYRRRIARPVEQGAPDVARTKESKRHGAAALFRNTPTAGGHRRACLG